MERYTLDAILIPKKGTHGNRVERFPGFWNTVADDELSELFFALKPYFALEQHKHSDLDE